ncbi:MAG: hypothetical protein GEV13_13640 [Rhodospirillales bacterium]|nr:hypothetical protein [Rhodospirillales bacterium]
MDKLNSQSVAVINDAFGRSISLTDLITLLYRFQTNQLSDSELVQVIQMGSYFARNKLSWALASANLDHWLNAGSLPAPTQIMDHKLIMNLEHVVDTLCGEHYDAIVAGINSRLSAPAGTKFPASAATFTGPSGKPVVVNPAESPLRAGGEEAIYKESGTPTSDSHLSDMYNAVGGVFLVSRANVKSEVLDTGGWQVTIVDWEVWFWDTYDWNTGGQSVSIPLDLFNRLPAIATYQSTIEGALKASGIPPSVLQELKVNDAQMRQIEGKKIAMPDGSTMQPKAYPIYGDSSWRFDASSACGKPTVLTIASP